jgi:hypothetical protein
VAPVCRAACLLGCSSESPGQVISTARSVDWCSASIWSAPDGSGLLTLDASSVQTAPEGSCRIVWTIKRTIKPCDAAPLVTQTTAGIVERSPEFHLVTPDGTATRTQPGPPPRRARSRPGRPDDPRPRPGGHQGRVRREHRAGTSSRPTSRRATGSSRSTPPTPRWRRPGTSWTPRSCTGPAARAVDLGRGVHLHRRERLRSVGRGRRRRLGVRLRPGDVPAGLPRAAAAGNRRGGGLGRVLPVERPG